MKKHPFFFSIAILLLVVISGISIKILYGRITGMQNGEQFNGDRAYANVKYQVSLGPRVPGSSAHEGIVTWMQNDLEKYGWSVEIQNATSEGHPIENVIAKRGNGAPWIILGAHYDSRMLSDQDPILAIRQTPVPGANDGASGVAVLLELARALPRNLGYQTWLVFFDAEDNGEISGWDWLLGSQLFVSNLTSRPDKVVVIDMIGDANLDIYKESNSNPDITNSIWAEADSLGYSSSFINQYKYSMLDDHTPFLNAGIPAVDIIDFDYPYWHTTQDTSDKVSPNSLQIVGKTLWYWLVNQKNKGVE
jgi:Zn-dependent M28 family amino/carboxypeptidase